MDNPELITTNTFEKRNMQIIQKKIQSKNGLFSSVSQIIIGINDLILLILKNKP